LVASYKLGDFDQALRVAQREIEVAPDQGRSYFDLAILYVSEGNTREAGAVLDRAQARGAGSDLIPFLRYIIAALNGDAAAMEREAASARGKPFEHRVMISQAQTAGYLGQLGRARDIANYAAAHKMSSAPAAAATVALTEALFGMEREARTRARAAIRLSKARRTAPTCALALALANDAAAAEGILSDLVHRYPNDTSLNRVWLPAVHGAIALGRGNPRRAFEITEVQPHAHGAEWAVYVQGNACLKLGLADLAAAAFRYILEAKGALFTAAFADAGAAFAYPAAQVGLARALAIEGQFPASRRVYEEFFAGWKQADANIPLLLQARREYARLPREGARRGALPP
jgi:eukaryotic-like serine/threonine-protein kinase